MRLRRLIAVLSGACLAVTFLLPEPAAAEPSPQDQRVVAASRSTVAGFAGHVSGIGDGLDSGLTFGVSAAFFFTRNVGVEGGIQSQSTDVSGTTANQLSGGTLDSTITTLGMVARFPVGERVTPYVVGGIAYFSNSYEIDPSVGTSLGPFNFELSESVENVLGYQVGGGIDVSVASHIAIFGDVRYLSGTVNTTAQVREIASGISIDFSGEQDLARLSVAAGVRVLF